jgi:hypothetical protein
MKLAISIAIAFAATPAIGQAPGNRWTEVFRPTGGGSHWIDTAAVSRVGQDVFRFSLLATLPSTLSLADGTIHDRIESLMELDCARKRSRVLGMQMLMGESVVKEIPGSDTQPWTRDNGFLVLVYCPVLRRAEPP